MLAHLKNVKIGLIVVFPILRKLGKHKMLHTKLTFLKNWTLHGVCWLTTIQQGCDPITSVTMNVNVIHWTEPSITWILHIGSLAIPICKCFFRLDHSCKKTSDCMTQCDILLRHWICQWLRTKTCWNFILLCGVKVDFILGTLALPFT